MSEKKRALVCGLGSIGRRHSKILLDMGWEVDAWRHEHPIDYLKVPQYTTYISHIWNKGDVARGKHDYDLVIISTPTEHHMDKAIEVFEMFEDVNEYPNMLIEKPLCLPNSKDMEKLSALIENIYIGGALYYVGYNLRYDSGVRHVLDRVNQGYVSKTAVHEAVCKTNVQKWGSSRPLDHVVLELSHEIDYLIYIFGQVQKICIRSKAFGFNESLFIAEFHHATGYVSRVILDYFSDTEDRYVKWYDLGGSANYVQVGKIKDETYITQMKYITQRSCASHAENQLLDSLHTTDVINHIMKKLGATS